VPGICYFILKYIYNLNIVLEKAKKASATIRPKSK
jgi:hypothetical protein